MLDTGVPIRATSILKNDQSVFRLFVVFLTLNQKCDSACLYPLKPN